MQNPAFLLPSLRPYRLYNRPQKSGRRPAQTGATPTTAVTTATAASATSPTSGQSEICKSDITLTGEDSTSFNAYLATPNAATDVTAGVVLLSDINGYSTDDTRRVADLLASRSLPTIVPDLFRGSPWPNGKPADESYETWREQHPYERVHSDIRVAVQALRERGYGHHLGLIGFCFGGGRLMHEISLVEHGVNPDVAVAFYPTRFDPVATGSRAACPLFFVAGDSDPLVPQSVIDSLLEALENDNDVMEDCEFIVAEGAGHAFAHRPKTKEDEVDSEHLLTKAAQWLSRFLL